MPREDDWHNVHDRVVYDHDDRIGIVEWHDFDASSRLGRKPEFIYRRALEEEGEYATDTKSKGHKDHNPDCPEVPAFVRGAEVEYQKRKLDEHVASKVECHDDRVHLRRMSLTLFIQDHLNIP